MKMRADRISFLCLVLAIGASALAQSGVRGDGRSQCSNRTLFGAFGAQIEGRVYIPNDPNPPIKVDLRTISLGSYDGAGNITFSDHVVEDGNPPQQDWRPGTGSYSVNPDCTGTFSVFTGPNSPPIVVYFAIVKHGTEIHGVVNGSAITYSAYKVN